jgi:hypothetical protein
MSQVIIYTNDNGGVSVCVPTGELPIEQVLTKDCPAGAIIVVDPNKSLFHGSFVIAKINGMGLEIGQTQNLCMSIGVIQQLFDVHLILAINNNRAVFQVLGKLNQTAQSGRMNLRSFAQFIDIIF